MNLVGKILTVLIFVMSLLFMAFALAVYSTHTNWKLVVDNSTGRPRGLKQQLDEVKADNQELKEQKLELESDLAEQKTAATNDRAKLESELDVLQGEHTQLKAEQDKLVTAERAAVAAMDAAHKTLADLRKQVETLRASIGQAQKDRDEHFKKVVKLTTEVNQAVTELKRLKARQVTLGADHAKALEVLRKFSLKPEPELYADQPPPVDGVVRAVTGEGLVEVSIGADDGLLKGHKLDAYREGGGRSVYVGRVEVLKAEPDRAVCKIDPKYQKSPMQKGDRVASKLQ